MLSVEKDIPVRERVGASGPTVAAPSAEFLARIPRDFAREHLLVSAGAEGGLERLLVAATTSPAAIFNTGVRLGRPVETMARDGEEIARAIDAAYGRIAGAPLGDGAALGGENEDAPSLEALLAAADRDLLSVGGKGPLVRLVDAILFEALGRGASDVHIQPLADRTLVRYRLDGVLHTVRELPARLTAPVISRVKVMGGMDIAEPRLPQDGRATVTMGGTGLRTGQGGTGLTSGHEESPGRRIDLRLSTLPTAWGERAVLRILERTARPGGLAALGMPALVERAYLERVGRTSGIVLVSGPTGSGKTTTLYSTLRHIAAATDPCYGRLVRPCGTSGESGTGGQAASGTPLNIMTIEDPIEYELTDLAVSQSQVNLKKGVTFATGLRHILRQDPDVIMVGEVRDAETARTAMQASLTGHLVLSTIHTADSASAATRLLDLGVEPYLAAASLSAVLAQRLVRTLHAVCGGEGCAECLGCGYLGRTGLFELLTVSEAVRDLIAAGAPASRLRTAATGLRTLEEEGRRLVAAGVTTGVEVARVLGAPAEEDA